MPSYKFDAKPFLRSFETMGLEDDTFSTDDAGTEETADERAKVALKPLPITYAKAGKTDSKRLI